MTKIIKYKDFVVEKYEANPEYRIKSFFKELQKNIKNWFINGALGLSGAVLGDIKISTTNAIEKNLIFEFSDQEFYYQVYVIMSLEDVMEDSLDSCHIKVKKYDAGEMVLLRKLGEDVLVKDLNEDKILELISSVDDESDSLGLDSGMVILDDEDSDLEDTSIV